MWELNRQLESIKRRRIDREIADKVLCEVASAASEVASESSVATAYVNDIMSAITARTVPVGDHGEASTAETTNLDADCAVG